jgi:hypothetical protein
MAQPHVRSNPGATVCSSLSTDTPDSILVRWVALFVARWCAGLPPIATSTTTTTSAVARLFFGEGFHKEKARAWRVALRFGQPRSCSA